MARESIYIVTIGMEEMESSFKHAALPVPPKNIAKLDNLFHAAAAAVQSKVHVRTGYLKSSGRADTHYVADTWIGEIRYDAHPGIFELARGDKPTGVGPHSTKKEAFAKAGWEHPTGGHFFFNAVEPFIPYMEESVNSVFDEYFSKADV